IIRRHGRFSFLNKFNFNLMPPTRGVKGFLNMFKPGPLDRGETTRYFPCPMANPSDRLYDIRVLERNVRKGLIARNDVEKYLRSLPDRADNTAPVATPEPDDDDHEGGGNSVGE